MDPLLVTNAKSGASPPENRAAKLFPLETEDCGWWVFKVQLFDQASAAIKHRSLIERSLIGNLAGIKRRRFLQQHGARHAIRAAGRLRSKICEQRLKAG